MENTSNLLLISGQSLPVMSSGSENMIRCYQERLCGGFTRSIQLPPHADVDRAKATCKNGLLEIEVPKRQPSPGPTGSAVGAEQQTETKATKRRSASPVSSINLGLLAGAQKATEPFGMKALSNSTHCHST